MVLLLFINMNEHLHLPLHNLLYVLTVYILYMDISLRIKSRVELSSQKVAIVPRVQNRLVGNKP
jgi:hypothetical protein